MTLELFDFQKEAVALTRARIAEGHRRLVLTVPCGGGKTVMAAHMMRAAAHRKKSSLFVAPARELIRQCSDKLSSYGVQHGVVMAGHGFTRSYVQVASAQTLQARAFRTKKISLPHADLVVVDEAHLFGGEKFMEILHSYPDAVVIGLTATPLGANNKPMPDDFYSTVVVGATTSQLISKGFIVPVRCWAPYTPLLKRRKGEKAFSMTGDYREDFLEKRMNKPKLVGDIVKHWVQLGEGRPTIVTAVSVAHSQAIAGEFAKKGIKFGHVDGTTEASLREDLFGRFKDGALTGLSSCGVLCLDSKTEILTSTGWVGMGAMTEDHQVANFVHAGEEAGTIFFDKPKAVVVRNRKPGERMVVCKTQRLDYRVTEDHRMVVRWPSQKEWRIRTAASIVNKVKSIPVAGNAAPIPYPLTDPDPISLKREQRLVTAAAYAIRQRNGLGKKESRELAKARLASRLSVRRSQAEDLSIDDCLFIGFFLAEGHQEKRKNGGGTIFEISQAVCYPKIIEWLDGVLARMGVHFNRHVYKAKGQHDFVRWNLWRGTAADAKPGLYRLEPWLNKNGGPHLFALNHEQWSAVLTGFWYGDGDHGSAETVPESLCVTNANKSLMDWLQAVSVCRGWRCSISRSFRQVQPHHRPVHKMTFRKKESLIVTKKATRFEEEPWQDEKVWCVTSTSGNIVTRRNGVVTITGNCTGVDFPWASCAILARPTKSFRLYLQIVGRAMRSHPSKSNCFLLDHAGCVAYHGFPDEDQEWKLGGDSDQAEENAKKREEGEQKQPIHCPRCHTLFANSRVCPNCGHEIQKKADPNKVRAEAGVLVEICRDPETPLGKQNLAKLWHKCLAIASARNETFGLAAHMFMKQVALQPWRLKFLPNLPPDGDWKAFVRDAYPQYTRHKVI